MREWELTPEERLKVLNTVRPDMPYGVVLEMVARAQVRKLEQWSEGMCPHGTQAADTSRAYRRECDLCWGELKQEADL